jgi:hypothetical protein
MKAKLLLTLALAGCVTTPKNTELKDCEALVLDKFPSVARVSVVQGALHCTKFVMYPKGPGTLQVIALSACANPKQELAPGAKVKDEGLCMIQNVPHQVFSWETQKDAKDI